MSWARRGKGKPKLSLDVDTEPQQENGRAPTPIAFLQKQLQATNLGQEERSQLKEFIFNKTRLLGSRPPRKEDFEVISSIGAGEGRDVYKVRHKDTSLLLAQKVIHIDQHPDTREQVLRELKLLDGCASPEIVCFYASFFTEERTEVNIIMEYMDGGCLDDVMSRVGRVPENMLTYISRNILKALDYLTTTHNVMHRDLKPSNILVNSQGECKLCDFGVSRKLVSSRAKTFVGTMRYMSPERIQGHAYDIKSDVWSYGLALIEMATGHYPIPVMEPPLPLVEIREPGVGTPPSIRRRTSSRMAIFDMVAHVVKGQTPKLPPQFTKEFRNFVKHCLCKNPKERYDLRKLREHKWVVSCDTTKQEFGSWCKSTLLEDQLKDLEGNDNAELFEPLTRGHSVPELRERKCMVKPEAVKQQPTTNTTQPK